MAYGAFADVYDLFNEDADYDALYSQVHARLKAHGIENGIVADLGCGTGDLTLMLAQAGYDMIGVDLSEEMLCVLQDKAAQLCVNGLLLLRQDLTQLDLFGTVRAAVSTFDTFNHIGPYEQFERALVRSALFIEPGGVFLFDMNTPYKHARVLADHRYEMEADGVRCTWSNRFDEAQQCTHITVETRWDGDAHSETEHFVEYAYTRAQIERACEAAGLFIEELCDGETFGPLRPQSERFLVTAVKRGDKNCNRQAN